ncbi:MAG TPA: lysine 2,3-aminomutase [Pseudonocardiaceae bacterium]|nr:lysine 2,3-aminomutase [Pseudonocardiaceae bacterium]
MTVDQLVPVNSRFDALGPARIDEIARRFPVPRDVVATMRLFSLVLPFRVNEYVLSELIDWHAAPDDPMFQLVFPNDGMLPKEDEFDLAAAVESGSRPRLAETVARIRRSMNPHPSGQRELNVPTLRQQRVAGLQHKYDQTVLYFPQQGQMCHAYCTYCFRWAQFVGDPDLRFAAKDPTELVRYLRVHPEVTDVLVTGGDPMVMSTERLRRHIEPILAMDSVRTIRIGTKSVAYWPQRFVSDPDADDALRLYERVVDSGRTLAVMGHYTHPRELATPVASEAVRRIGSTGARLFCQSPLIAHVNDDAATLARLWSAEFQAGAVPYYLFVARDTGPHDYFKVPLARAHRLFAAAYRTLPGLARTVRGPVMSTTPGKVVVDGTTRVGGDHAFQLRFLQARDRSLVDRPFHTEYDSEAAWLDELRPLPGLPADIAAALRSLHVDGQVN